VVGHQRSGIGHDSFFKKISKAVKEALKGEDEKKWEIAM
jgi:hypothetical protein